MRLHRPTYTAKDGTRQKSGRWWVRYSIQGRKYDKPTGTADRQAATLRASEIVKAAELRSAGIETFDETRREKLLDLVGEYEGELRRRGCERDHYALISARLTLALEGFSALADVTPERVRLVLGRIAEKKKLTPRTMNRYRIALFGFFKWLVVEGRWSRNPIEAVGRARETDPDKGRRALTEDELERLLEVAPPYRHMVYLVAAKTGLRRSELRKLTWADIDLASGAVTVRAKKAKNRREAVQPLPPRVLVAVRAFRGGALADAPVFPKGIPAVPTLEADLRSAGIEPDTFEGFLDLHALRVSYGTALARSGATMADVQKLMRHSDPRLTSRIYVKVGIVDRQAAVDKIDTASPLAAGGSDGKTAPDAGMEGKGLSPRLSPSPCIPTDSIALTRASPATPASVSDLAQPHAAAIIRTTPERCQSGRMGRFRKPGDRFHNLLAPLHFRRAQGRASPRAFPLATV